jgi:hypothetical protein
MLVLLEKKYKTKLLELRRGLDVSLTDLQYIQINPTKCISSKCEKLQISLMCLN